MLRQLVCSLAAQAGLRGFLVILVSGGCQPSKDPKGILGLAEAQLLPLPVPGW